MVNLIEASEVETVPRVLKLNGRVAVVTGSDSGMGQAMAEAFSLEGADIAITFHSDQDGAAETARQVEAAGRRSLVQRVDVRDETSVAELFKAVDRELGTPYILVNNAGKGSGGTAVVDTRTEDFDDVVKTDLYGPFFCCREFIQRRQSVGGLGKIINITSVHEASQAQPIPLMAPPKGAS
jgi:glucose 1-dehydrogenase